MRWPGLTHVGIVLGGGLLVSATDWAGVRLDLQNHLFRSQFEFVESGVETEARFQSDILFTVGLSFGGE